MRVSAAGAGRLDNAERSYDERCGRASRQGWMGVAIPRRRRVGLGHVELCAMQRTGRAVATIPLASRYFSGGHHAGRTLSRKPRAAEDRAARKSAALRLGRSGPSRRRR